ncbi:MAG: ABC transporter ATP-binding protein [Clostridia bacterium]|nr:ABC transporter ATP-binding protein [Clostridia bacterium]
MASVLEIKNISKSFGKKKVLDSISFTVDEGEIFGFLGPNGSGKTTTIKMILGLLKIDEGQISICGCDVKNDFENAIANVGGIIENPEMYKNLTGKENLMQYARMYKNITKERIDEVVKIVGLEGRINDKISKYSLGMRQRLGIAQAILHKPKLLVLDEPTNGLDPDGIKQLREIFFNITRKEKSAVLVSSHMLAELDLMCDRIGIIDRGRLVDIKTMNEIRTVSDEEMNEYEAELEGAEEFLKANNIAFEIRDNGRFAFSCKKSEIPAFVKSAVENGVSIYALVPKQKTLEEAYMETTSHNVKGGVGV